MVPGRKQIKALILGISIFFTLNTVNAQFVDSIRIALEHKPRFSFRLDNRNSFTATTSSRIIGVKIGAEFDTRFRVGGGINLLRSYLSKPVYIESGGAITDTIPSYLKMNYMSYFIEYVFYRTRRWEFSVPIQIGIGHTKYVYFRNEKRHVKDRALIVNYETNITGHYKIFSWFGVGAGLGYQLMLKDNPAIKENFNTPVYVFKLKIFLGEIYRSVFPKKS